MKPCTKCGQVKPLAEFHRKPSAGDGCTSKCKVCRNQESLAWHWANREKHLAMNKARYEGDPEKARARTAQWRAKNPEAARVALVEWRKKNRDHVRSEDAKRLKKWKASNRWVTNADSMRRYAAKGQAAPSWCDHAEVKAIYQRAHHLRQSGQDVQVDHLVPLRSPLVCGLHVPANLAIVPTEHNMKKGNRVWPEMP